MAAENAVDDELPSDLSAQHDHDQRSRLPEWLSAISDDLCGTLTLPLQACEIVSVFGHNDAVIRLSHRGDDRIERIPWVVNPLRG
jgi:hypothetical protein